MLYDVQKMMAQLEAIEKGSGPKSIYCIQSSSVVQSWMLAFESKPHPGVSIPHTTWPGCTSGPNYLVPPGLAAPQAQITSYPLAWLHLRPKLPRMADLLEGRAGGRDVGVHRKGLWRPTGSFGPKGAAATVATLECHGASGATSQKVEERLEFGV